MNLYSYFRSSAAYRVRIALNLKGIDYSILPVNLLKSEQLSDEYAKLNPSRSVPTLEHNQAVLTQSLAIIEWLEEEHPTPPLLPGNSLEKYRIRSLAYIIGCDIHPINNLRVLKYLKSELNISEQDKAQWYQHWITLGFDSLEQQLADSTFCCGDTPTLADLCLVPQVYNARRFNVPLAQHPKIQRIYQQCNELDAFIKAAPEQQADAPN